MRNPFSTYVYHGGSMPSDWNITHGWVEVTGISLDPSHWFSEQSNHKMAAIFLLKNAKARGISSLAWRSFQKR